MEMDFHGMKRKDLQTLCKKHGIPANLKNIEMATRLASVLKKEDEETVIETKCSIEDGSIEEENLVDIRKAKRVRFSPESENEVFEFTRSVKKLQRKNVKKRSQGTAKDLQQGGNVELKRSKRTVSKGITVAGSNGNESISVIVETDTKAHKVPRRSKRIRSSGIAQEEYDETDLIGLEQFEDKEIQDGLVFEKVGRRSTRLAAKTTKSCVDGWTSKSGTLLPAKERTMQSCETKTAEPIMISENVLDSTSNVSVDVSLVRNAQELHSECMVERHEEKHEQDIVMMTAIKNDKELASSLSEFLIEHPEVSIPESELFDTQPSSSVQLAVSNSESDLGVPTGHVLVKDIAEENIETEDIAEENIETEEVAEAVHSFVAKLAEADAVLEDSAECWNESLPSKDDERGSLEKEKQSANQHGNFFEYITENTSAEEQGDICTVGRISASRETLDEVNDDSQTKFVPTMFSERGCKPNAMELLSTGFASLSPKEENVSDCLEEDEMKDVSQAIPIDNAASNALDRSFIFTTPERNLLLMEQLSVSAADIVTQHNDDAVESHAVVFTTPEQVLLLGDYGLDEVGKEEEHTTTDFPDEYDVHNTSQSEANGGESIVVELHEESNVAASPLRQSNVGDFKEDGIKWNEENRTVELHCESSTCTSLNKHALLGSFVSDGAENSGGSRSKTQLNSEFMEEEREEKQEQDTVMVTATKNDKEVASSLSKLLVETTQPSSSVQLEVSNPESELGVPTGHVLVKDAAEESIEIEEIPISVHSCVAKLAETDAVLENSAECWNESLPSKDDERGSLEKEKQSANQHGNFSEYNTENTSAEEQADICTVGRIAGHCVSWETLDEVNDDSQTKFLPTISSERGCKPNALEQGGSLSTDFTSLSPKEENVSECLEEDESLMLVEQLSESGKISAADIVTQHNDEAVESHDVVFRTPEQVLLLGDSGLDDVGKKEEQTTTCFPDEPDVLNTSQSEAINGGESIVVELHDESNVAASSLRQFSVGDFKGDGIKWNEEIRTVELHCESDTCTSPNRHALLGSFVSDGAENSGGSKAMELYEESVVELQVDYGLFTGAEKHLLLETDEGMKGDNRVAKSHDMSDILTASESHYLIGDFEPNEAENKYRENNDVELLSESNISTNMEGHLLSGDCGLGGTREMKDSTTASCVESFVFSSRERRHHLGNSEPHTAGKEVEFPGESDVLNTSQSEARNRGESTVAELHDVSNVATSPLRQSSVGDFKEDGIEQNEENKTVELHYESGTCASPNKHALLGSFVSDEAENSGGSSKDNADKSGLCTSLERQLLYGDSEQKKAVKTAEEAAAESHDESAVSNIPERYPFPEESELEEAEKSEDNKAVELQVDCDLFTSAEKHLLLEKDEGMKGDNRIAKSHDMSDVLTDSESHSLIGENKDVELLSESNISTDLERHLLSRDCGLGGTREIKDSTAASCVEPFVFSSPERQHHLENSEPHTAGKEVEFKDESAFFTRLESHLLLGESGQDRLGYSKSSSSQYQIHHASSPKVILKDDNVVWGSHLSALDLGENTIADSSGSIASKLSYSHEFNAGEATPGADLMPKISQEENVAGLDATQGTSKQSRWSSPHVDSVNLFAFDIEVADTIMDAERTASFSSYVLALPAKGNSETVGEITSPLKVSGTSTLMSEESSPSTKIQNQINDELEEVAITGSNEVDELIESNTTQRDHKGNLMLHYSGGSSLSGKTCTLGGTEDEHLGCSSQEDLRNTCEKSGHRILEDETNGPIATAFEKNISLTPNECNVEDNINEEEGDSETMGEISSHLEVGGTCSLVSDNNEADELTKAKSMKNVDSSGGSSGPGTEDVHLGFTKDEATDPIATVFEKDISLTPDGFLNNKNEEDEEMVRREATPSPEETLSNVDIGESGTSYEKQVRREPILIYRTQVKPKRHDDMKENAPNSKIVDNLNVTAPRTSKRQPLQDLGKN